MLQTFHTLLSFFDQPSSNQAEISPSSPKKTEPYSNKKMSQTGTEVSRLNEYAQKNGKSTPIYNFKEQMIQNKRVYTAECTFVGRKITGTGASSKNEAKRLVARQMLIELNIANNSELNVKPVQEELVISNELDEFDKTKLDKYLDIYLDDREKDFSKFRRIFIGNSPEKLEEQYLFDEETVTSPKSKTLDQLKITDISVMDLNSACLNFKKIVQEMKLIYFAEFLETSKNDRYAVSIKLSMNLFTVAGVGANPEKAIEDSCKMAIELLSIFNL